MVAASDYAAEADETRERIAATVDELQDRLNPRRIVGDAVDRVQAQGNEILGQARDTLKTHPMAIAAVGAAIGLAFLTRAKIAHAKVDLGDDFESYTDYDDDLAIPQPTARLATKPTVVRPTSASNRIADNPVVAILAGLAAGALIGALLPASEAEASLWKRMES